MPEIIISVPREPPRAITAYARAVGLSVPEAIVELAAVGLETREGRQRGGRIGSAMLTPEQRIERGRAAAAARWAKAKRDHAPS